MSATRQSKPLLYSFWRSSCSWRVRIALKLKDIPFEIEPINLTKYGKDGGEQNENEFEEINPMRFVPTLRIDGTTLIDSLNIIQFLEETRPQKPLLPHNVMERARVREISYIIISGIQPLQNSGVLNHFSVGKDLEWARHWINRGFTAVEKLLSKSSGTYSVGDEITLADCCITPQVYNARRYGVDLAQYPIIERIDKKLSNHPAFADTHPFRQPDCPPKARQK